MSLGINYNSTAVRTHQSLTVADRDLSKVLERLSTGVRLNRSSDDPASMVLANSLRYQLRGLQQATSNSEAGVNLLQTAEGALDETSTLLNRMRQLAIAAANDGVNSDSQLGALQDELDAAISSVNRIATDSRFGSLTLLNGQLGGNQLSTSARPYVEAIDFDASQLPGGTKKGSTIGITMPLGPMTLDKAKTAVVLSTAAGVATAPTLTTPIVGLWQGDAAFASPVQLNTVPGTLTLTGASGTQTIPLTAGTTVGDVLAQINATGSTYGLQAAFDSTTGAFTIESTRFGAGNLAVTSTGMNGNTGLFNSDITAPTNGFATDGTNHQIQISYIDANDTARFVTLDQQVTSGTGLLFTNLAGGPEAAPPYTAFSPKAFNVTFKDLSNKVVGASSIIPYDTTYSAKRDSTTFIHTGALSNQRVAVDIPDMRASALGFTARLAASGFSTLQSLSNTKAFITGHAQEALMVIDAAIDEVSRTRGSLGSIQSNAIETTLDSLRSSMENLTSSESQLRDTDFALESANFAKQNILYQAATAMLGQANQVPQTVLKLLEN